MNLNLINILSLFSSILLLLLGCIFLFYPHGKKLSNYLLGIFMFSNSVLLGNFFATIVFPAYTKQFPIINHIGQHSYLLLAPLLYLYIISLCYKEFHFRWFTYFHFLPYIIITGLSIIICILTRRLGDNIFKIWQYFHLFFNLILNLQIGIYIALSFIELKKYRSQLNEIYSNIIKIDLMWINLILYFFILMWLTDLSIWIAYNISWVKPDIPNYLLHLSISTDLILSLCLIYKGMRQTTVPLGIISMPKYSQAKLDVTNYDEYKKILTQFMENEKPYLLPELNLDDLAKKLGLPPKHLSQTIHFCFNQNFNNYINQYRVNEAKRIMEIDEDNKKTLYEILFDAGFNSKSVFNEWFKKITGFTPKEYRKK